MKNFTKTQKVIKVGNSYAVTLDKRFVDENQLEAGQQIIGSYSQSHVAYAAPVQSQALKLEDRGKESYSANLTKTEQKAVMHSKVTPEFTQWVDKTLDADKEILERLANL